MKLGLVLGLRFRVELGCGHEASVRVEARMWT
jgi:hypothetical protein